MLRSILGLLLVGLALSELGGPALAQQSIDDVARRQAVAAMQLEEEIGRVLGAADKMRNDPAAAIQLLKRTLDKLDRDDNLRASRKTSLTITVKNRIREFEVLSAKTGNPAPTPVVGPDVKDNPKPAAKGGDTEYIQSTLSAISVLRSQGKVREAQVLADNLARKYPDNPAVQLARVGGSGIVDNAKLIDDKEKKTGAALLDVDRSATPIAGNIEYSPDFARISKERMKKYREGLVKLTETERAILEILDRVTPTPTQLKDVPFEDVIKYLQKSLNVPMIVDKRSLEDLKLDYSMPITVSLPKGISNRTLLRRILADVGLTYIVKNERVEVMSVIRAEGEMTVRYYRIDEIVAGIGFTNPNAQLMQAQQIIDLIQTTFDRGSWDKFGGPGTIVYVPQIRTLIIKNTAEVHAVLGGGTSR